MNLGSTVKTKISFNLARGARRLTTGLFLLLMLVLLVAPSAIRAAPANPLTNPNVAGPVDPNTNPFANNFGLPSNPNPPSVGWSQIKSTQDAQDFFGVSDGGADLIYRNLINGEWAAPTEDNTNAAAVVVIGQLVGNGNKVKVQIFRSRSDLSAAEYNDPTPSDHRNLTLVAGKFSETTAANNALTTFMDPLGLGQGTGLLMPGTSAIIGLGDAIFNGNQQNGQWVFTGDGNPGVQQVLTCGSGGSDKSNFVYVGGQKPIVTALKVNDLTDSQHIADINHIYRGNGVIGRNFDSNALSAYLCSANPSKAGFDTLCNQKLKLPTCVSDKKGLLDALGGLFDPIQWALDQLQSVVSYFMGFVVDGLRQITDIGNLASNSGVTAAWKVMRDLANVLFILVLGAIAFSTILRIDTQRYGLRSLLPRLIGAVIGVNFSLLFITILVDTATVLGNPFLSGINILLDQNPVSNTSSLIGGAAGVGASVIMLIASLVVIIVMIGLLLLLVVRIVMIWLLAAFAPLAFLFSVLPFSRSLAMQWLKQLIKWTYMAPIAYVVLWVGARFLSAADSLDAFILSILVFIGVCVAAIIIPLKLGGEVMQRATNAGKGLGKGAASKGLKSTSAGRAAQAYVKRRQDAQDQGAQLRASGWQGALSERFPGRLGQALTGGSPAQIGAQQAGLENKYAGDIKEMGNKVGVPERKMIAEGRADELRGRNLHAAADLASRPEGRRAAGRLLGQSGHLTQGFLQKLPPQQRQEQIAAGNQGFMKDYDPVLAAHNSQGQITPESIQGIKSHVGAVGPEATKEMYWGDIRKASFEPGKEGEAGQAALGAVSTVSAAENVKVGARNRIAPDGERDAFVRGVLRHGNTKTKQTLYNQLKENKNIDSNDNSAQKYKKLAEGFGVDTS